MDAQDRTLDVRLERPRPRETDGWPGARNFAAAKNIREMSAGDPALVYRSGGEKAAVGIAKAARAAHQDPSTKWSWVAANLAPVGPLAHPVTLATMKTDPALKGMQAIRQGRLSVSGVSAAEWKRLMMLGRG